MNDVTSIPSLRSASHGVDSSPKRQRVHRIVRSSMASDRHRKSCGWGCTRWHFGLRFGAAMRVTHYWRIRNITRRSNRLTSSGQSGRSAQPARALRPLRPRGPIPGSVGKARINVAGHGTQPPDQPFEFAHFLDPAFVNSTIVSETAQKRNPKLIAPNPKPRLNPEL